MVAHHPRRAPIEELIIYVLLAATGAIPVTDVVRSDGTFGVEATIGLLMILTGLAGMVGWIWKLRSVRSTPA